MTDTGKSSIVSLRFALLAMFANNVFNVQLASERKGANAAAVIKQEYGRMP
jgi:hypothetical protein